MFFILAKLCFYNIDNSNFSATINNIVVEKYRTKMVNTYDKRVYLRLKAI